MKEGAKEGTSPISVKKFCLTVPYNFLEDPFCVRQTFWYQKKVAIRVGRVSRFSVTLFCLTVPKVLVKKSFSVSLSSSIEKG